MSDRIIHREMSEQVDKILTLEAKIKIAVEALDFIKDKLAIWWKVDDVAEALYTIDSALESIEVEEL